MFGAPGVGKGTIADLMAKEYDFVHLSAGDVLRAESKKKTKTAKIIEEYTSKGLLLPSNITIPLMLKAIKKTKSKNIILDGFPRNIDQAKDFMLHHKINLVIDLNAPEKVILDRLSGRRICPKCRSIYHIKNLKPKIKGICDKDNEKLIQRKDDNPKVVKERLKIYKKETYPLENFFKKKNILKKINASDNPENIIKRIKKILKN
jgi:adenylate kinase